MMIIPLFMFSRGAARGCVVVAAIKAMSEAWENEQVDGKTTLPFSEWLDEKQKNASTPPSESEHIRT